MTYSIQMPDSMRLTAEEQAELDALKAKARAVHLRAYKRAKKKGRDYPLLPYECSWAFEMEFLRRKRG